MGFANCIERNPVTQSGPAITHSGCGTHTPIDDPGSQFIANVDLYLNGNLWGTYDVTLSTRKLAWLDFGHLPPTADCGLQYTLTFNIQSIVAASGNAQSTPENDTGDPGLADQGVDSILHPPLGAFWGSDT